MDALELLKQESALAFEEMRMSIEGVSERLSWAVLLQGGSDYLNSDGSIHGITLHVATCKVAYGSTAFRGTEIRWRDLADRVELFEPSWPKAVAYLQEAHQYWVSCWERLLPEHLERDVPHFSSKR